MSIGKQLKREAKKFEIVKAKVELEQNLSRFKGEVMANMVKTGETYQRYWNNQPVIATRCKLVVNRSSSWNSKYHTESTNVVELNSTIEAIEIATFSQWLDSQYFYVLNEKPESNVGDIEPVEPRDLWYMMQFNNFAPMGMDETVYLEPVQGSVEYILNTDTHSEE